MLVTKANMEDPYKTASEEVCLSFCGILLSSVRNLRTFTIVMLNCFTLYYIGYFLDHDIIFYF